MKRTKVLELGTVKPLNDMLDIKAGEQLQYMKKVIKETEAKETEKYIEKTVREKVCYDIFYKTEDGEQRQIMRVKSLDDFEIVSTDRAIDIYDDEIRPERLTNNAVVIYTNSEFDAKKFAARMMRKYSYYPAANRSRAIKALLETEEKSYGRTEIQELRSKLY